MKQKHIVIVDGLWVGHHPVYVRTFARILVEAGYRVSVFCPVPEEIAEAVEGVEAFAFSDRDPPLPGFMPRRIARNLAGLQRWRHISRALQMIDPSAKPDMVFFAWLDPFLNSRFTPAWLVDRIFPFAWSGLYFHPRHLRMGHQGASVSKVLPAPEQWVARSANACSVAILDAGIMDKLQPKLGAKAVFVFPDFADETVPCNHFPLVDEIRQKARGRKIIGLLGSLTRRKGLLMMLNIARQEKAQDWYFVFAGHLVEQTFSEQELTCISEFLAVPRDNCFAHFGKIADDANFNALVNVCDVIFAVYQDFPHSSNLVTKAAAYGKNLLVASGGYMEEVVRQYELGEVVPEGDMQAALDALSRLTVAGTGQARAVGMQAYSSQQSQERLRQVLLGLVDQCVQVTAHR